MSQLRIFYRGIDRQGDAYTAWSLAALIEAMTPDSVADIRSVVAAIGRADTDLGALRLVPPTSGHVLKQSEIATAVRAFLDANAE